MSSKPQFQLAASLPVVSEAPGRGILPGVSRYTAALPVLYQLDDLMKVGVSAFRSAP
jgi:hypothetical protein